MSTTITTVDARGQSCPGPLVGLARALRDAPRAATFELLATDPGSQRDFVAWCRATGHALVEHTTDGPVHRFLIRRK